jgi:carbamoyltransferase
LGFSFGMPAKMALIYRFNAEEIIAVKILGISAFYHDSAAALLVDGRIVAAVQEERFSRKKHDASFPEQSIRYCLEAAQLKLSELDVIAYYEKPFLKLERILQSFYDYAPYGFRSFVTAMPIWFGEKLYLKSRMQKALRKIDPDFQANSRILFPEHHLSHAASAYYPSGFTESAILTIDGVGEWASAAVYHAQGNQIKILKELHFPHSVGLLYSAFTQFLGFRVNNGEYKLMGLAAYGDPQGVDKQAFVKKIKEQMLTIFPDGSIRLNLDYFGFLSSLQMIRPRKWEALFGLPQRTEDGPLEKAHANLAYAIQQVTEEIVFKLATHAQVLTGSSRLCLAGGVALNCVCNGMLQRSGLFEEIFVQPAAGDAGGALGAALAGEFVYFKSELVESEQDHMQGSLLGPEMRGIGVEKPQLQSQKLPFPALTRYVARKLAQGKIVAWCQGRAEYGPRALGNRSILADPRLPDMQQKINETVKRREDFRPFAPAVLAEHALTYFQTDRLSPYMLMVHPLNPEHRHAVPENFSALPVKEQLLQVKSAFPAITHADFSARLQTVDRERYPLFHSLLQAFHEETGCPMLINTSFNLRGQPIVHKFEEAFACFMQTELDILVVNEHIWEKN